MLVLLAGLLCPFGASAQDINDAVTLEDLGFTQRLTPGGRPSALAGAYTSLADDSHALIYNPAGLARVRRIEFTVGFQHQRDELENAFFGSPSRVDLTSSTLDYAAVAYPYPTYRGSFVVAFGAYRVTTADVDILNRGLNTTTSTLDDYRLQQSGDVYSYNLGAGVDLSPELSAGATVFFMDGTIRALTEFAFDFLPPFNTGDLQSQSLLDDAQLDLDGYGGVIGLQYHPHRRLHFGLALMTPIVVNLQGRASTDDITYFFNSSDSLSTQDFSIDEDYQIPLRIVGGVSLRLPNVSLIADVGYSDWTQAQVNDFQLKDADLRPVFREVVEWRGAVELTIPRSPLRLRGGYAYLPDPLKYLQADRIEGDEITPARTQTVRRLITGGFGVLVGKVLTVDASYEYQTGEKSIPTLRDKRTRQRVLLSASYRF